MYRHPAEIPPFRWYSPMKKLKLNVDDVIVTSIEMHTLPEEPGTVYANSDVCTMTCSCWPYICPPMATRIDC
jgi:hypothetical protein